MQSEISVALKALFPPGSISDEEDMERLIDACSEEFEVVLTKALSVTSATPSDIIFSDRWRAIGVSETRPYTEDTPFGLFSVSNTLHYFTKTFPGVFVEAKVNELTVKGIKNKRFLAVSSRLRSGQRLSKIARDQKIINDFELIKHAHVTAKYEEELCTE